MKTKLSIAAGIILEMTQLSGAMETNDKFEVGFHTFSRPTSEQANQTPITIEEVDFDLDESCFVFDRETREQWAKNARDNPITPVPFTSKTLEERHPNEGTANIVDGYNLAKGEGLPYSVILATTALSGVMDTPENSDYSPFPDLSMGHSSKGTKISPDNFVIIPRNDGILPVSDLNGRRMYFKVKIPDALLNLTSSLENNGWTQVPLGTQEKPELTEGEVQKLRQCFLNARVDGITSETTYDQIWAILAYNRIRPLVDETYQIGFRFEEY